jgi:indole-3-glycerol phosphate synthase
LFSRGINTFLIGSYFMDSRDLKNTLKSMELGLREKKLI